MSKILILLSHPAYNDSRANKALIDSALALTGVDIVHLESLYPDGKIDPNAEVARILGADNIVFQFPVQWYSTPPLLKAWQDIVLTRMFYVNPETEGKLIAGKKLLGKH